MGFHNPAAAPGLAYDTPVTLLQTTTGLGTGINGINGATGIPNGSTSFGPFDTNQYQSIHLLFNHDTLTLHTTVISVQWVTSANVLIAGDTYRYVTTDGAALAVQLPVRGDILNLTITEGSASQDSMTVVGSYRIWEPLSQSLADRVIASGANAALGAGATLVITPIIRYDGPVFIGWASNGGAAAFNIQADVLDLVSGLPIYVNDAIGTAFGGVGRCVVNDRLVLPRNSVAIRLTNFAAGAVNAQIEVVAAPEGT